MKYFEVKFSIQSPTDMMQDARDIVASLAGEAGFETFEETTEGTTGYVQQTLFDRTLLDQLLAGFPLPHTTIDYTVNEAEDRDWNEEWENEGFEPIVVEKRCVIHDGRHLGTVSTSDFDISIEIDAKLAFGTGTHETTRMMVASLLTEDLTGKQILDCGTGTGILAIAALKQGAAHATGYDIDEWSVDNARHNAVINRVDRIFEALLGDSTLLDHMAPGCFDVVLANINRNILLADLPRFRRVMATKGRLFLSGFYQADIPLLEAKAAELGLTLISRKHEGDWACLAFAID